jgi:hypothetical protein
VPYDWNLRQGSHAATQPFFAVAVPLSRFLRKIQCAAADRVEDGHLAHSLRLGGEHQDRYWMLSHDLSDCFLPA